MFDCKTLGYSGRVETRRKAVGQHIKQSRRALKFRSAKAFGAHIGIHESSVANAEIGSERAGDSVYEAIERGLGWPNGSIRAYVDGTTNQLPGAAPASEETPPDARPTDGGELTFTVTEKDRRRWRQMTAAQIIEEGEMIGRTISERMQVLYLRAALAERDTLDSERA